VLVEDVEDDPVTALNATTASKKTTRAAVAVAALAAGAVLVLSGCSAGQISQTAQQVSAVNGNSATIGKVALRDVRFLLPQSEEYNNSQGGKAVLAFSAVNTAGSGPDELTSITSDLGTVQITPANPELAPQQPVVAADPAAVAAQSGVTGSAHQVLVEVDGLTKDVTAGLTYPVTFNFRDSGTVLVDVPVDAGPSTPSTMAAGKADH
jgi:hypothetical protein